MRRPSASSIIALRSFMDAFKILSASPREMMWWLEAPMLTLARSSKMSLSRTWLPLIRYWLVPSPQKVYFNLTSSKSILKTRFLLLKIMATLPRLRRAIVFEPFQIRSSPFLLRSDFIDCSPRTKRTDSAMLDLPEPFGPTIAVMEALNLKWLSRANDLNPDNVSSLSIEY